MSGHTPGPWDYFFACQTKNGYITAGEHGLNRVAKLCLVAEDAEMEATARLISAAPDLLAACEGALELLDSIAEQESGPMAVPYPEAETLRAAIAKAKGE